jgi:hypothetical protein
VSPQIPDDPFPLTALAVGATQLHELYVAYMRAGFTESQAMSLILAMVAAWTPPGGTP